MKGDGCSDAGAGSVGQDDCTSPRNSPITELIGAIRFVGLSDKADVRTHRRRRRRHKARPRLNLCVKAEGRFTVASI
jgi:hypothetical protein